MSDPSMQDPDLLEDTQAIAVSENPNGMPGPDTSGSASGDPEADTASGGPADQP